MAIKNNSGLFMGYTMFDLLKSYQDWDWKKTPHETKEIVVPQTKDVAVTSIGMAFSPEIVSHGIFL